MLHEEHGRGAGYRDSSLPVPGAKGPAVDLESMRRIAEQAARRAGEIQRHHLGHHALTVVQNRFRDLKIEVDFLSEAAICDLLRKYYPQHGILTEENGLDAKGTNYIWIVDPLDGTINYYFGIPLFCVSVACYRLAGETGGRGPRDLSGQLARAEQLVGVVYAPLLERMYSAAAGCGATCNGRPLPAAKSRRLQEAMVGISFGSDDAVIEKMEALNAVLVRRVKKVRIFGSTGLDLAHVAMGHLSALIQLKVQIWDVAAALVILKESGMRYDVRPGLHGGWQFIAAAPSIFQSLKEIVDAVSGSGSPAGV